MPVTHQSRAASPGGTPHRNRTGGQHRTGRQNRTGFRRDLLAEVPAILRLAVPVIVGLVSGTLMGVVDTLMIAPLGTDALAAAGLATSALILVHSGLFGLLSVTMVAVAQAHGAGDLTRLAGAVGTGLRLAAAASLGVAALMLLAFPAFSLLSGDAAVRGLLLPYWAAMAAMTVPYALFGVLRGLYNAVGRPWVGVWAALAGVALNIPLNGLLIHGAGLGLAGAGLASLIAKTLALALLVRHWRRAPMMARYRRADTGAARLFAVAGSWRGAAQHVRQGWAVALGSLGKGGAYAVTGLMMAGFGTAALAAHQAVHAIGAVLYMVPMGMTAAVAVRMGQAVGAGDSHRYRPIWAAANGVMLAWAALVFAPLLMLRGPLAGALSTEPAVAALAATLFVTMACVQFADGLQSIALGALRGRTDNRTPNLISLGVYWLFALPLAALAGFALNLGPGGVLAGYALGVLTAALILQHRFWSRTRAVP